MPLNEYLAKLADRGIVIPEEVVAEITTEHAADIAVETQKYTSAEAKITQLTADHAEAADKLLKTQAHNYELSQQVTKASASGNPATDAGEPSEPAPVEIFH